MRTEVKELTTLKAQAQVDPHEAIGTGAKAAAAAAGLGMTSEQQVTAAIQAVITSGQDVLSQATSTASVHEANLWRACHSIPAFRLRRNCSKLRQVLLVQQQRRPQLHLVRHCRSRHLAEQLSIILPRCDWLLQAAAAGAAAAQAVSEFFSGTALCLLNGHAGGEKVSHVAGPQRNRLLQPGLLPPQPSLQQEARWRNSRRLSQPAESAESTSLKSYLPPILVFRSLAVDVRIQAAAQAIAAAGPSVHSKRSVPAADLIARSCKWVDAGPDRCAGKHRRPVACL